MEKNNDTLVISYLNLRRTIGMLGVAFPVILALGSMVFGCTNEIQDSISGYYHTCMRNSFVGILCAYSFFLFSYKGYAKTDNIAANLGSVFALGVAFMPTAQVPESPLDNPLIGKLHLISASLFFLVLIYFSLFLFTKTSPDKIISKRKKQRNAVYKICGVVMLLCVICIAAYLFLIEEKHPEFKSYHIVFWFETIALWSFGVSWIIKGELLLKDE